MTASTVLSRAVATYSASNFLAAPDRGVRSLRTSCENHATRVSAHRFSKSSGTRAAKSLDTIRNFCLANLSSLQPGQYKLAVEHRWWELPGHRLPGA